MFTTVCSIRRGASCRYGDDRKTIEKNSLARRLLSLFLALLLAMGTGGLSPILKGMPVRAEEKSVEIKQILPIENGIVAVVYTDGTVKVSENARFYDAVSNWKDVEHIYYNRQRNYRDGVSCDISSLIARTKTGMVLSTEENFPAWSNVKEVYVSREGVVGLTNQGKVLAHGEWEDDAFLTSQTNVKALFYHRDWEWYCIKNSGGTYFLQEHRTPELLWWGAKELRYSGHGFYAIMKNGSVKSVYDQYNCSNLRNAVKVIHWNRDLLFGLSADGRLLTHDGGNLYINGGNYVVAAPGSNYYEEVDVSQYNELADIVSCWGLILLKRDGSVESIGKDPRWDLRKWHDISKVEGYKAENGDIVLMGLKKDGSVIVSRAEEIDYDSQTGEMHCKQTVTDQYRGWELQQIYGGEGGVVGVTTDGKLVGDGAYENVDFSVFDR